MRRGGRWRVGRGRGEAGGHDDSGGDPSAASGGVAVLVDEPAAGRVTSDRVAWADRCDVVTVVGCALVQAAVGSMGVVVLEFLVEQQAQLLFVPDDGSVEEFVAQGANPSLGERVCLRCPWRDPKCRDP